VPLGDYIREITVDTGVVTGQVPPAQRRNWWPWIVAGLVVAGLVWMSQDEDEEDDDDRPFAEAG